MQRPFIIYPLILLNVLLGVGAFAGGGMLMLKPDGSLIGMERDLLRHSPFHTYFIPGLFLFFFNGVFPLFTSIGLFFTPKWHWANVINIYREKHWAWTYSLYSGIIAIIWIILQQFMTNYFWLQPVVVSTGVLIIIFTMIPTAIRHFELKQNHYGSNT